MSSDSGSMQGFVFYDYTPSMVGAVIMIIIFLCITVLQIKIMISQRTWYFIPFIIGCIFEAIGYVGRALSSNEAPDFTQNPYIMQSLLLLLGPTLLAASIYMVLGRLVVVLGGAHHSTIQPKWLTKVFVLGDVLSFVAQGGGGGYLASAKTQDDVNTGNHIIIVGLGIQILFFGFFIVTAVLFHMRIHRQPTVQSATLTSPWQKLLLVLYASSALIMVRSIYRVAEYIGGSTGSLEENEIWLYVFDAVPMTLVVVAYTIFHPSCVVTSEALEYAKAKASKITLADIGAEASLTDYASTRDIRPYSNLA